MKYIVQIDDVCQDRPSGSIISAAAPVPVPFEGWVELLRVLERAEAADADRTAREGTPS